ncbi:MAG: four helix bundle protein [Parcubacteria group bacterium]|nr:four helix bundle protein [Parcubacteria group bacterium]
MSNITIPPRRFDNISVPIVHRITVFYKDIYKLSNTLSKRDKLGIHSKIENLCLECLELSIEAALLSKDKKQIPLQKLRINIEILKRLIRISQEIGIITTKIYLQLESQLQEISKMATNWLNYTNKKQL